MLLQRSRNVRPVDLFRLGTALLVLFLAVVVGGSVTLGIVIGRRLRQRPSTSHEPVGVVQGTLLGLVGLLLAFGLSMAVGRYEERRSLVVQEANDISTTYLRARLLAEPQRSESLALLATYAGAAVALADETPDTRAFRERSAEIERLQPQLWDLAGEALANDPVGTAPRLYIEVLNDMFDTHTSRVASLDNRVPTPVRFVLVFSSAIALGALALFLTLLGRGASTSVVTAVLLLVILFVTFDLDRPHRGFIRVPDSPLVDVRDSITP